MNASRQIRGVAQPTGLGQSHQGRFASSYGYIDVDGSVTRLIESRGRVLLLHRRALCLPKSNVTHRPSCTYSRMRLERVHPGCRDRQDLRSPRTGAHRRPHSTIAMCRFVSVCTPVSNFRSFCSDGPFEEAAALPPAALGTAWKSATSSSSSSTSSDRRWHHRRFRGSAGSVRGRVSPSASDRPDLPAAGVWWRIECREQFGEIVLRVG